jgi:subtilase family serine protease
MAKSWPLSTKSRRRGLTVTAAAVCLLLMPAAAAVASTGAPRAGTPAPGGRVTVDGARPSWATASADRGTIGLPDGLSARVYLAGRDPAGLRAYALSASDPRSRDFRHFLTPTQVQARFGPTGAQVRAVRSWLSGAGLTVTGVTRHYVAVTGTVAAAERAFKVAIHSYAAEGGRRYAPAGRVSVPTSLAPAVLGVTGLDNGEPIARPQDTLPGPAPLNLRAGPCSSYFGQNQARDKPFTYNHVGVWTECGLTPQQVRSVYGADTSGLTGKGVTVAVVDPYTSPTMVGDMTSYTHAHGTADFRPGQFTQSLPSNFTNVAACGGNAWYTEESIDIDAVHNMAPDANVEYVGAASCSSQDLTDALSRIVDNHLASIVSNSWGFGPADTNTASVRAALDQVFQQAAAEGIGIYFASGDCGADDPTTGCAQGLGSDTPQAEYPAESPWVTAVGGTSLAIDSSGHQLFQSGWGELLSTPTVDNSGWTPNPPGGYPDAYDAGSGGGISRDYAQPQYQKGVVPAALATSFLNGTTAASPMRVVPDIAAVADNNTGMLVGQTQLYLDGVARFHETRYGGTSLAAPLFAGLQALAQQAQGGVAIGFANPQIYARYGSAAIQDVTDTPLGPNVNFGVVRDNYANPQDPNSAISTRLDTFAHDGLLHATVGYDDETGVGAPSPTGYLSSYRN